jgi:hypothetical protein
MPASEAIFQRYQGPGLSRNQSPIVAAAKSGTAQIETKSPISSSRIPCPRKRSFR